MQEIRDLVDELSVFNFLLNRDIFLNNLLCILDIIRRFLEANLLKIATSTMKGVQRKIISLKRELLPDCIDNNNKDPVSKQRLATRQLGVMFLEHLRSMVMTEEQCQHCVSRCSI